MKKYLLVLLTITLLLSACTARSEESSASLIGSWKLSSYGPVNTQTPAVASANADLTFKEDGTLEGNSGCNSFGGNYTVKSDQIRFDQIISTLMACDDPRMVQERAVQKVLKDTAAFKIEGNTLTIVNKEEMLTLTK